MGVKRIYEELLKENDDTMYGYLLDCLSRNTRKENLAKLAGIKAFIKRKDSSVWAWTIIMGIVTILFDAIYNLLANWQTYITIPQLEIRDVMFRCKGIVEKMSTNDMFTITTTLNMDTYAKVISAIVLISIPIGAIVAMRHHEKYQYLLSVVESVESDYKNKRIPLNEMDSTTTNEIAQRSEVDAQPLELEDAIYKKFVVYVKT